MFGLFGNNKKPQQPVKPYIPQGMPVDVAIPNLGIPMPQVPQTLPPELMAPPDMGREASIGRGMMSPGFGGVRPPPGVQAPSMMPPRRPSFADRPAPGAAQAGPSTPAPGQQAGPGYEYFQTQDDMGRSLWSTRPQGHAGGMGGQEAAPQFQKAGTGMTFNQAQQSIGAGSGVMDFFNSLKGGGGGPPGSNGISVPPGMPMQGPMPNGQSMDQVQPQMGQPQMGAAPQAPAGFQNPLVPEAGSAAGNFLKLLGIGGF